MSNDLARVIDQLVAKGWPRDFLTANPRCWCILTNDTIDDYAAATKDPNSEPGYVPRIKGVRGDLIISPSPHYSITVPINASGCLGRPEVEVFDGQGQWAEGFAGAVEIWGKVNLDNILSSSHRLYLEWELKHLDPEPSLEELEQQLAQRLSKGSAA